ncbi:hypothetical protein NK718_11730 [Alsobacter sp. SYSU M60028]|uniref:Uncharacterized protein n=1 Tax=Alsobacter ponti TaxID=2962936 RepID=A0ABT1LE62_9HYPH|nr:hypothetical protein [Alsobacter ponti]MCP8939188.1 hypothetical protein [Alsobacter ponti]
MRRFPARPGPLVLTILAALATPAAADDPPFIVADCAPRAAELAGALAETPPRGALAAEIARWLEVAASQPDGEAERAYDRALQQTVTALRTAGVRVAPVDVMVWRFQALDARRRLATPPMIAFETDFPPLEPILREMRLIVSLSPPSCRT